MFIPAEALAPTGTPQHLAGNMFSAEATKGFIGLHGSSSSASGLSPSVSRVSMCWWYVGRLTGILCAWLELNSCLVPLSSVLYSWSTHITQRRRIGGVLVRAAKEEDKGQRVESKEMNLSLSRKHRAFGRGV